jgi:hypothetical protein
MIGKKPINEDGYPLTSIKRINNEPDTIITFEYLD